MENMDLDMHSASASCCPGLEEGAAGAPRRHGVEASARLEHGLLHADVSSHYVSMRDNQSCSIACSQHILKNPLTHPHVRMAFQSFGRDGCHRRCRGRAAVCTYLRSAQIYLIQVDAGAASLRCFFMSCHSCFHFSSGSAAALGLSSWKHDRNRGRARRSLIDVWNCEP